MNEKNKKTTEEITLSPDFLEKVNLKIKNLTNLKEEIKKILEKDVTEVFDMIIAGSILLDSSDIHIEPSQEDAKIRMRIDGILQDVIEIDKKLYEKICSRVKLISKLKINLEDKPQDGRFSINYPHPQSPRSIEVRASTLPSEHGEAIVMRLLDPKKLISFPELGFNEEIMIKVKREIEKPNGMIVLTGPTGSGKTTTLYAFLDYINNPEIKIITIENPIEYHLEGISQTEVNPSKGYDFANGLRAIVRQDPDAILVGEIRDLETASISLQAALTGHTVFSTLHTNDAAGAVSRLRALGEKAVNISPAINLIIAQRLLRKLCSRCKKSIKIKDIEGLWDKLKSNLEKEELRDYSEETTISKPRGCKRCNFTGYKGRLGVFEVLVVDEEIKDLIFQEPPTSKIRQKAIEKGMKTIKQDAFTKLLEGKTTLEEIERII